MAKQGLRKPTGGATLGDWMGRVGEAVTVFGMSFDNLRVMPLHSLVHYAAADQNNDAYNGKWISAAGGQTAKWGKPHSSPPQTELL